MRALAAALLVCATGGAAAAGPLTIGLTYGGQRPHGPQDSPGYDALYAPNPQNVTAGGVFARLRLADLLSVEVEAAKLGTVDGYTYTSVRSADVLAVVDLAHGPLVPMLFVGAGIDDSRDTTGQNLPDATQTRREVGAGLEYRSRSGVVLGVDLRAGTRTQAPSAISQPYCPPDTACPGDPMLVRATSPLHEGEYVAAWLRFGVRL